MLGRAERGATDIGILGAEWPRRSVGKDWPLAGYGHRRALGLPSRANPRSLEVK